MISLGIDPGARYTAAVITENEEAIYASTWMREITTAPVTWAENCYQNISKVLTEYPSIEIIGIEGISDPKGFSGGKQAALNPKDIIKTGIVLGRLAALAEFKPVVIIPPKNNGSGDYYPKSLLGKRTTTTVAGTTEANVRRHERSAYDIAQKATTYHLDGWKLDTLQEIW